MLNQKQRRGSIVEKITGLRYDDGMQPGNNALPPKYSCEFCDRPILRSETEVYFRVRGWSRLTTKGKLDGSTVLHDVIGGTACRDCIDQRRNRQEAQLDSLF